MLIARISKTGQLTELIQCSETTRLGRNIQRTGMMDIRGLQDTVHTLIRYRDLADQHHAQKIRTVGTQVFRLARNGTVVSQRIQKKTGLSVRVLSETEEAENSYVGAVSNKPVENALVIDIGGGSTELAEGNRSVIRHTLSVPAGAVTLTDCFLKKDPPDPYSCKKLQDAFIDQISENWKHRLLQNRNLICVGGTVTTLASIHLHLKTYDSARVDGLCLQYSDIQHLLDRFCACALKERKQILFLNPARADIIMAGTLILLSLMNLAGAESITVSDRGLRHGIALKMIGAWP